MIIPHLSRYQWLKVSFVFGALCTMLAYLIASRYLDFISVHSPLGGSYLIFAFLGQIGLLGWLGCLLVATLTFVIKLRWLNSLILIISASLMLGLLALDTQIYALYRFHLSGFVWNLLFSEGGSQIFSFSWYSVMITLLGVIALCILVAGTLWLALRLVSQRRRFIGRSYSLIVLLTFLTANVMHIWYDAHGNPEIRAMTRHLPLYEPATAVRFMAQQGWIDPHAVNTPEQFAQIDTRSALKYPTGSLTVNHPQRPNILFITVDAWRADSLDDQTTPFVHSLINQPTAHYFSDHHSGGNVTKGGLFSLFYALPPTYWDAFTANQQAPVFFTTLQALGYKTGIYGSGPLINPSFHRNVFSQIDNLTTMTAGDTPWQRDIQMVQNFQDFLTHQVQSTEDTAAFVGFLFFDAAHGYAPPEDYQPKFEPYWQRVDHVALGPNFDPLPYKNRYRTALHFIDQQIKGVIDDLKQRQLYDNTIIIISSDHGEEFNENGLNFWGHGSNFSRHQTQVPLLILWPNTIQKHYTHRTSHYDIVPTLMQTVFEVSEPMKSYSSGVSLFDTQSRPWILVHSYFNYGLVLPDLLVATYPTGQFELTDTQLQPTTKPLPGQITFEVLQEISRFYQ